MERNRYVDFKKIKAGGPEVVIPNEVDTGGNENSGDEGVCSRVGFPFVGIRGHTVIDTFIDLCVEGMLVIL